MKVGVGRSDVLYRETVARVLTWGAWEENVGNKGSVEL